jgi:hypothetical protein
VVIESSLLHASGENGFNLNIVLDRFELFDESTFRFI